jgi:hypothetical protein
VTEADRKLIARARADAAEARTEYERAAEGARFARDAATLRGVEAGLKAAALVLHKATFEKGQGAESARSQLFRTTSALDAASIAREVKP